MAASAAHLHPADPSSLPLHPPSHPQVAGKLGEGVNKKQLKAVEELSKAIVNKILHGPMTALRCDGTDPEAVTQTLANMEALERMFQLGQIDVTEAAAAAARNTRGK